LIEESTYKRLEQLASEKGLELKHVEIKDGKMSVYTKAVGKAPSHLPDGIEVIEESTVDSAGNITGEVLRYSDRAATPSRLSLDPLTRDYLDLARPSVMESTAQELYKRSIEYYRTKAVYGSSINILTNYASKGFENDIDDLTIKNFYDNWVIDSGFDEIVEKIFFDFFRVGLVRTYKTLGKYEPKINHLSVIPGQKARKVSAKFIKETSAPKNRYSAKFIPVAYTILNPTLIVIRNNNMFGQSETFLKAEAGADLKKLLQKDRNDLTDYEKKIIDNLPNSWKVAIEANKDIPLDPSLLGYVDYRKMPYETYPIPRGARAFEAVDFKDDLMMADSSTLDGITSYILKVTVGNDTFPVKNQDVLETASRLFDTASKSFKVVWDHTLNIEKITSPEMADILGPEKYVEVDRDMTAALNFPRALIDGESDSGESALTLAVKSVIEEINYARTQVKRWIHREYAEVAKVVGFDRYPNVRFDDMALRDELAMMSIVQGMIDRRIISYQTGQKKLGFDPTTEVSQLESEKPLVLDGTLGILGSPYQQSAGIQSQQRTPSGTPSEGRPKGKPTKTPEKKDKTAPPSGNKKKQLVDNSSFLEDLNEEQLQELFERVIASKKKRNIGD
jgi:hypothetical protein